MTPLNEIEREAMEEWWHETEQPPMIGFARAVWPSVAFWIAFTLFIASISGCVQSQDHLDHYTPREIVK